jgi:trk system potassium uptake protein
LRIVILGAGQVGASVAENLVSEQNDITVVDLEPERLKRLQDRLDLRTVAGNAAHPAVLEQAGARDADMILAVTQSDETNMVACKLAATMFNIPTKIARIRSADYLSHPEIFSPENFAVDFPICPEQVLTDYIVKLLEFPEALQVLEFAGGRVEPGGGARVPGRPSGGSSDLRTCARTCPMDARVAAIFRHDTHHPGGQHHDGGGRRGLLHRRPRNIRGVMRELRRMDKPVSAS